VVRGALQATNASGLLQCCRFDRRHVAATKPMGTPYLSASSRPNSQHRAENDSGALSATSHRCLPRYSTIGCRQES
jgi:hypothetical protein